MAEIQRKQDFLFPVKRCFEGVLRVWPVMEIQLKKSDPVTCTAEGYWSSGGGALMVFRVDCRENGSGSTEVTLRHDMQWTPVLSRPNIKSEKAALAFNERVFAKMDGILETLGKYLTDESSLPKITPGLGLDLDHLAWIIGAIVSIGMRFLTGRLGPGWLPGLTNGAGGPQSYLRLLGVVGVFVGGVLAGLIKRRNPLKGNAFFEGMLVALANVWMSIFIYQGVFTRGCLDWGVYGLTGLTTAALASMKYNRNDDPA